MKAKQFGADMEFDKVQPTYLAGIDLQRVMKGLELADQKGCGGG